MIFDISPTDRPFTTAARKTKATNSLHEWQTDALAAASPTASAIIEGDDASANTADPTVRLNNELQTIRKVVAVSGRAKNITAAARADEFQYQLKKRMSEVGRDLEAALTQNNAATAGSAASAPLMASFESWIASSSTAVGNYISMGQGTAQTTPGVGAGGRPITAPTDSTTAGTLTEAGLKYVIKECWLKGGEPSLVMCGPEVKQKISGAFTGIATRFRDVRSGQQAEIVSGADAYISDFGVITIVANRFQRARTVLVVDPQYIGVASLRGFTMERLGKNGDSERAQIVGDYTLEVRNQLAQGKIADVNGLL
jgi:hypothetical protein